MSKGWCNTEDYLGYDPHYAHASKFDWITIRDKVIFACEDCRYELEEENE